MLRLTDADALAAAFGLLGPARLDGPVDRGELGQVWRLDVGPGAYAIKETFGDLDDEGIARAYAFAEQARIAGVSAPHQHRTLDGGLAVREHGAPVRCFDWVDLEPPDRDVDAGEVGRTLAALHRVGGPADGPVDPFFTEPVARWDELITAATGAPFAAALTAQRDDLVAAESIMAAPASGLRLGHRDLFADNLRRSGDRLVVIDWDNAGPIDPAHELGFVLAEFGTTPARATELITAYAGAGGPATITGPADFTMAVAVLHHLLEIDLRRWLDATDDHGRERAAARVAMFTDDPFGTDRIRRLLEVISAA